MNTTPRYRRGDPSPVDAGLVFFRYNNGKEVWLPPSSIERKRIKKRAVNAKQRAKPEHKSRMKSYFSGYNQLPKQKAYRAEYYQRPEVKARIRARQKERLATDLNYAMSVRLRNRIGVSLRSNGTRKAARTEELIGCTVAEFRIHFEKKFTPEMDWDAFVAGKVVVDHVVPVALFDLRDEAQQRAAFNFRNLQPMWKAANLSKSDFIEHNGQTIRARELRNIIPFQKAA